MSTKVVLVGNAATGKTHALLELLTGDLRWRTKAYIPTQGVSVHSYQAGKDQPLFQIWDTAGQESYSGLSDGYYIGAERAIICTGLLEKENPAHYGNQTVEEWEAPLKRVQPNISITVIEDVIAAKLRNILK